jgi:hypothetical protein
MTKKDGYVFVGEFLKAGVEIELPVGSVVIEKEPTGSVKNGSYEGNIYLVVAGSNETDENAHLELQTYYNWHKEFLTFRDAVNQLIQEQAQKAKDKGIGAMLKKELAKGDTPIDPLVVRLNKAIDHIVEARLLLEANSSAYNAVSNAEQILANLLEAQENFLKQRE